MTGMRKTISLNDLMDETGARLRTTDYATIAGEIQRRVDAGEIAPVTPARTNGYDPPLALKYKIVPAPFATPDVQEREKAEMWGLAAPLSPDYYFSHPERYHVERRHVLMLSDYLGRHRAHMLAARISLRERCFEIWQYEKAYEEHFQGEVFSAREVLAHCGIGITALNCYQTVEPVPAFSLNYAAPQIVLIVENSDTFYSFWNYLSGGHDTLFTHHIDTIVYGSGNKINALRDHFDDALPAYLRDRANAFLYLGDLDYEGVAIFENLRENLETTAGVTVLPFVEGYEAMLAKGMRMQEPGRAMPRMKDAQHQKGTDRFLSAFPQPARDALAALWDSGRYIPQEILSDGDYGEPAAH